MKAMRLCYEILKVAVEPSGAIRLVVVLSETFQKNPAWRDCKNIATVVSGANIREEITGLLHMVAHDAQSYSIDLTMSVRVCDDEIGEILQTSKGKLELKESYYRHNINEFVKPVSTTRCSLDDIHLNQDDLEMYIDLAPFLNPSPYVVPKDMSLIKAYNLFRQLGLRHLLVIPRPSHVTGLITRKDLLMEDGEDLETVELKLANSFKV